MMQVDSVVYGLLVYYQQVLVEDYKYLGLIELSLSADRDSLRIAKGYGGQQQEVARLGEGRGRSIFNRVAAPAAPDHCTPAVDTCSGCALGRRRGYRLGLSRLPSRMYRQEERLSTGGSSRRS
jgi:hypothetical protein